MEYLVYLLSYVNLTYHLLKFHLQNPNFLHIYRKTSTENCPLHMFLLLHFLAHDHLIPSIDMVKLFADREVQATIIPLLSTLPLEYFQLTSIFPYENMNSISSPDLMLKFIETTILCFKSLWRNCCSSLHDYLVADLSFTWATDSSRYSFILR